MGAVAHVGVRLMAETWSLADSESTQANTAKSLAMYFATIESLLVGVKTGSYIANFANGHLKGQDLRDISFFIPIGDRRELFRVQAALTFNEGEKVLGPVVLVDDSTSYLRAVYKAGND